MECIHDTIITHLYEAISVQTRKYTPSDIHFCSSGMQVAARLATTGDVLFSSKYSTVSDLRVWELRLHLCQAVKSTKYFSWMLFLHHKLIDDIAMVAGYVGDSGEQPIVFQTVQRGLRPPTDEERWAIIDCIDVHHRSHLWNIMSRGIQ